MIDVSQVTSYGMILLCVFGALLLIGFLKGFLGGFWKSVIKLVLWVALIVATIYFAPVVGAQLATTGFIEGLVSKLGNTDIVNFLTGAIGPELYNIVAGLAMLILGSIIIGLIGMIMKSIFRRKGFFSRLIASIFSLAFNAVIVTILFIISTSPLLFNGAQKHVDNNEILTMYQDKVVEPVQGLLKENQIPSSVEEIVLIAINQEPTEENLNKLFNVITLMTDSDKVLAEVVVKDGSGNITGLDQVKAKALYSDLVFAAKIINDMEDGAAKDEFSNKLQTILNDNLSNFIYEGNAVTTVTVDEADHDAMNVYMASLGFTSNLENIVNKIFVK